MEKVRMEEIKRLGGKLEALEEVLKVVDETCRAIREEDHYYDRAQFQAEREGDTELAKYYAEQASNKRAIESELCGLTSWLEQKIEDIKGEM